MLRQFALIILLLLPMISLAKENPDKMLERLTQEITTTLKRNNQQVKQDPAFIYQIVEDTLVPYIDWGMMSQWVIGRHTWTRASDAQKKRFAGEFKTLLIRTYASTLRAYNNQTIQYLPIRGGTEGKRQVQVSSIIKEFGKEPIQVTYRLVERSERWKVYDISIEGVSLLKGFQSQFAQEVQQSGMDALINRLHQHNAKPLT